MRHVFANLDEALTPTGVRGTLERVIDKAEHLVTRVSRTPLAAECREMLYAGAKRLQQIAAQIRESDDGDEDPLTEDAAEDNPYGALCPACGAPAHGRCRCPDPHTLEQLQRGHGYECANGHRWSGDLVIEAQTGRVISEKAQPKLNKYDPGSLLGWTVHLLEKEGLDDVAAEVRAVSRSVSKAWMQRER